MAENETPKELPESEKKMTGPIFWIVLGIVAVDDILDIVFDITVVGAPVASAFSIFVLGLSLSYMFFAGVSFNTRFAVRGAINFFIEIIPYVQFLPGGMLFLILTRLYENDPKIRALIGTASLGASKIGSKVTRKSRSSAKIEKMGTTENPNITRFKRDNQNNSGNSTPPPLPQENARERIQTKTIDGVSPRKSNKNESVELLS